MCRPSANTENSRRTREKPLIPSVVIHRNIKYWLYQEPSTKLRKWCTSMATQFGRLKRLNYWGWCKVAVSLAPVFWMSRNVPPKERLRDIQKTAARETSKAGVFCRALNRQRVGTSQKIIPRERLTSQSRGGRLRKKANKENQPIFFFQPRFSLYTGGRTGSF